MSAKLILQQGFDFKLRTAGSTLNKALGEVFRKPLLPELHHHVVWPFCDAHHTINLGANFLWRTDSVLRFHLNTRPTGEVHLRRGNWWDPQNDTDVLIANDAPGGAGSWPDIILPATPGATGNLVGALQLPAYYIVGSFDTVTLDVNQLDTTGSNQDTVFVYGLRVLSF